MSPFHDFLKGRLLACGSSPDFESAENYFNKSISADELSGAIVPAAQTRYYLAQLKAKEGKPEIGRSMLGDIKSRFQSWGIPVWQRKTELALEALNSNRPNEEFCE